MAAKGNLSLKQFDDKTAFLNGDIDEVIYIKQPHGFSNGFERVCKLVRNLYGLKQCARCRNQKFTNFLSRHNPKVANADLCIIVLLNKRKRLTLGIYIRLKIKLQHISY